jgi:Base plate wedge protein 53
MATNFFENFPRIAYTLDDGQSEQIVKDIFKRAILSKEFQNNNSYYETYEVLGGETPEQLSFRFYGVPELYWLILLTNNIIDPRFEWPLSQDNLIKQTQDKYGSERDIFTTNRAVNAKGYQVETFFVLLEDSTHKNPKRLILETSNDQGINTPIAYKQSEIGTDFQSNYEIEEMNNESYRSIKILKAEIVERVLTEYNALINQ